MSIVSIIDTITAWADREICNKVMLKVPPEDDADANDAGYEYKLARPACFPLFIPSKEKIPPGIASPIPSLCVRVLDGTDDIAKTTGTMTVEFALSTWDTGTHGKDVFFPYKDDPVRFKQWDGEDAKAFYDRNYGGWRDAWNFVDVVLREIESAGDIDGIQIDREIPIKFGPYADQEGIPDFYPFWYAWVTFSVRRPLVRDIKKYNDFL